VAQVVAGFSKVFVGEMIERGKLKALFMGRIDHPLARAVQARRGDTGPLSPDHLREAYVIYQHEFGRVGAARPLRSKKLFVR
jgi:transcription initiation factor TFIID subunit 11